MHIILVNRWYPPYTGFGGVAAYQYYLAHALTAQGHQVSVLAARWSKDVPSIQQDGAVLVMRLLAVEWSRFKRLPLLGRYVRPLQHFQYSQAVSRILSQMNGTGQPDIVEFAEVNGEGYHYLRRSKRLPVVVRCHTPNFVLRRYYTSEEMPFDTNWTGRLEAACILNADALSAPSASMAKVIADEIKLSKDAFTIIPNALDTKCFIATKRFEERNGKLIILHVGRLERIKGIECLAQAFVILHRQVPNTSLVFIGDDRPDGCGSTWRLRLENFFRLHGMEEVVHFTGGVDQAELLRWYARVDIAAVPSMLYESFSYTSAQAMAAGLPVVVSNIGGIPETVGNTGKIVQPGDVQGLAGALQEFACHEQLRSDMGQKARSRALQFYEAEKVALQTLALYRNL